MSNANANASNKLPSTTEEIRATATPTKSFAAAYASKGSPPGDHDADIPTLKKLVQSHLPTLQQKLADSRPSDIAETEHIIPLETGFESRVIVVCSTKQDSQSSPSPVVVLFHGGGYCLAFPEAELKVARSLASRLGAIVVCPSTRLAPEDPFPRPIEDGWAALKYIAADLRRRARAPGDSDGTAVSDTSLFPGDINVDPARGFVVGGTSSGAHLAAVTAHLARDSGLEPPLTGQYLSCGAYMDPENVPERYRSMYLSYEQNKDSPVLNREFLLKFREALKPDRRSPLWAPFVQSNGDGAAGARELWKDHVGLPPAYFQVCGMDIQRDDGLIYEKVLREECGGLTRIDLYRGLPHCWWDEYPELDATEERIRDAIDGFGWILGLWKEMTK